LLDFVELAVVLVLYVLLFRRLLVSLLASGSVVDLAITSLLLVAEGAVVVFLITRRRATQLSVRLDDWLLALAATSAPLLIYPSSAEHYVGTPLVSETVCLLLLVAGVWLSVWAKFTLGRSMGCVPANRGVVSSGPYAWVRHPMYAGYLLVHIAYLLANPAAWTLLMYATCWGLQIPRLRAEERLLSQDEEYQLYRTKVRYRLLPGVW
jgi:protein-S-isoprenylcysteine O-methyltransferase Ste14